MKGVVSTLMKSPSDYVREWRQKNPKKYRDYMRRYMRKRRAKKRKEAES